MAPTTRTRKRVKMDAEAKVEETNNSTTEAVADQAVEAEEESQRASADVDGATDDIPPLLEPAAGPSTSSAVDNDAPMATAERHVNVDTEDEEETFGTGDDDDDCRRDEEDEDLSHMVAHEVAVLTTENQEEQRLRALREIYGVDYKPSPPSKKGGRGPGRKPTSASQVRRGLEGRHRSWSAVPDVRYDKLLYQLRHPNDPLDAKDDDYRSVLRMLKIGKLKAEYRFDPAIGVETWRLIDTVSDRIVVRVSEIDTILAFFYDNNEKPGSRTLVNLANRHYCGLSKLHGDEFIATKDKGQMSHGVQFQKPPKVVAERCMQHVQIDLTEMVGVSYGNKTYSHMLTIQCLFSRFVFARALTARERGLVTRHLMDVFSAFGPPEAYQSYTGGTYVDASMPDVASMFHVDIHCYSRNGLSSATSNDHYMLRKKCYEKSVGMFGDELHWVEILPLSIMERNMKPQQAFLYKLTPFEIMYGRQPWPGSTKPPWLMGTRTDLEIYEEDEDADLEEEAVKIIQEYDAGLTQEDTYWKRSTVTKQLQENAEKQTETRHKATNLSLGRYGRRDRPGQLQFIPGDEVYVRSPDLSAQGEDRYSKALVLETSRDGPWPYKVQYEDIIGSDDRQKVEWVHAPDVTAATKELERIRREGLISGKPDYLCQCEDATCRKMKSRSCTFNRFRKCCVAMGNLCEVHDKQSYPYRPRADKKEKAGDPKRLMKKREPAPPSIVLKRKTIAEQLAELQAEQEAAGEYLDDQEIFYEHVTMDGGGGGEMVVDGELLDEPQFIYIDPLTGEQLTQVTTVVQAPNERR